ncbi:MAG: tRNA (adenosine(37)-N6)-dimethylallyltransferase MiaA [Bacteroidales bacterium]|nr:tRNA (adenosine(37)-N6)-dimethylallyltransferase MiaA [Bacteroidales bacterium]
MEYDLITILGPTASGKTKYAVRAAKSLDAEILSADSRQVYRGMDIGTGKDLCEYDGVPYHLIDIVNAGTKYNIFEYQRDFEKAYQDIVSRGKKAILCGGSGLYIESVTQGYKLQEVAPNPELRAELERYSDQELIAKLEALKPLHNNTDYDTRKRLIRALEIAIYQNEHPAVESNFLPKKTKYIGINVDRDTRNFKIDKRLDQRLEEGMLAEVQTLLDSGISPEDLIYYGLEYKFITLHLIGELSFKEMRDKLAIAIHQFAKRQMTWFRGMERRGIKIEWVEPDSDINDIL